MRRWWTLGAMVGVGVLLLVGCSSGDSKPQNPPETKCQGGNTCKCPKLGRSLTRCAEDGSEVCDCPCADFQPTEASGVEFNACRGDASGAWELTSVDLSELAGKGPNSGCLGTQVEMTKPLTWLMFLDDEGAAQMRRGPETIRSHKPVSCLDATTTCEGLGTTYSQDSCGTCEYGVVHADGIVDNNAVWFHQGFLDIRDPDFRGLGYVPTFDYDYCASDSSLVLRWRESPAPIYNLTRRYLSGTTSSCFERSLSACEDLGGCHQGRCNGSSQCGTFDNQADCESETLCSWYADRCGGTPTKTCAIEAYGVDADCTISDAAP